MHLLTHLLFQAAIDDPNTTLEDFKLSVSSGDALVLAVRALGRALTFDDLNGPEIVSTPLYRRNRLTLVTETIHRDQHRGQ